MMKIFSLLLSLPLLVLGHAWATDSIDLKSDAWSGVDALGRTLPGPKECGPPRSGKFIGMFYFLWAGEGGTAGPYDLSKIQAASSNPNDPQTGKYGGGAGTWHHWGEPELGYYVMRDPFVIRRHAAMLADAGVDTLIFDTSNGYLYTPVYQEICDIYAQMRAEGYRTPQICFLIKNSIVPSAPKPALEQLYDEFYAKNLHSDLWFQWQGKPLVLTVDPPTSFSIPVQNFFTFRQSWAWTKKRSGFHGADWWRTRDPKTYQWIYGQDKWPWLDDTPQNYGWHTANTPEEVSVAIAQHPDELSYIGRSCSGFNQPGPGNYQSEKGIYFGEQWASALAIDPAFIMITSWNEWIAQRQIAGTVPPDVNHKMLNQPVPAGGTYFVDSYNQEFSRDAEPMKGGHTDNYYYQIVANIRRFKGVRPEEVSRDSHTLAIDGDLSDWNGVGPEFLDRAGDAVQRNSTLWGSAGKAVNTTGRNDFTLLKVAHDAEACYFYAQTKDPITPRTGANWMQLFIDADDNGATGWEGYDYMVKRASPGATTTTLERCVSSGPGVANWNWVKVADVPYKVVGNKLHLKIRRADLDLDRTNNFTFNFHWADNVQQPGDILEFSLNGDSAPDRRFNYRYHGVISSAVAMLQYE